MARVRKIDFKSWDLLLGVQFSTAVDSTFLGGALGFLEPATILRMIVQPALYLLDATRQVGDGIVITTAIGIISSDAFAAGAGSVPDPAVEAEYPWLFWKSITLHAEEANGDQAAGASVYREVDSINVKSMRKIKPREILAWIIQTTSAAGAPATVLRVPSVRVLVGT